MTHHDQHLVTTPTPPLVTTITTNPSTQATLTCTQSVGCLEKEDLTEGEEGEPPLVAWEPKEFLTPPPPLPPPASDHLPVADIIEVVTVWARAAPAPVGKAMDRGLKLGGGDTGASSSPALPMASAPLVEPPKRRRIRSVLPFVII